MKKVLFRIIGWSTFAGLVSLTAVLSGIYLYLNPSLPDVEALKQVELQIPLRVFSADGKLIGEFGEKRRDPITFDEAPEALIDAILSAEDDGFYSHQGVDIKGLLRAASELAISGSIQSGGSTITMQVARNFFLSRKQTFSRKFNEILLAIKIEQELSKQDIMALYLNKIFLGNRAYGFKAAAQVYYGKPLKALTLAQSAMIAGLPKAPSRYNPIANPSRALIRRDWILGRMKTLGKITEDEYQAAIAEPITATYHGQNLDLYAPYVAEMAREEIVSLLGEKAYTGGYKITTTVDSRLQEMGQKAVINGLLSYTKRHGYRGPENTLDTAKIPPLKDAKSSSTEESMSEVNLLPWLEALQQIPTYGGLAPAAVIGVKDKSVTAILATAETITIDWKNGLNTLGKYVNENFHSPHPKTAKKALKTGDIIRIYQDQKNQWHITQIPLIQGSLTALDPSNGAIKTIVGGFDFNQTSFNRASQAKRLPGSNFKPFVYSIGLEHGLTAASVFNDAPIVIEDSQLEKTWRPENSSGKFYGPTRLRKALYLSRNLVSIRLLRNIGIDTVINSIPRFGIDKDKLPRDLSIALGTYVMTPLEIAAGYSVFANNGYRVEPFIIDTISDSQDNIVYKESPLTVVPDAERPETQQASVPLNADSKVPSLTPLSLSIPIKDTEEQQVRPAPRVLDERVSFIMNSIMRDVVQRGTAKKAKVLERQDIGGKTGTTNGPTDAWFSGYNQHLVTTAWVGFDNNTNIGKREYGGTAALPIWIDFMREALKGIPDTIPVQPDGIVTVRINPETGDLTGPENPNGIDEMFLEENVPTEIAGNLTTGSENTVTPEELF